jgi:hypothetical protein
MHKRTGEYKKPSAADKHLQFLGMEVRHRCTFGMIIGDEQLVTKSQLIALFQRPLEHHQLISYTSTP